ncbi:hypothetical protein D3C71_1079530 [compost metagenome]
MQNVGGFGHLDHEGGATAGQIVRRPNTGEDAIDWADLHALCRNVAADISQQGDQRSLAHVGTFTAHIRAGNDQHPTLGRQVKRVSNKRLVEHLFNHWMTPFADTNTGLIAECRASVVQRVCAFCQVHQHVQLSQGTGAQL